MNFNYASHIYTQTLNISTYILKILTHELKIFLHYLTIISIFTQTYYYYLRNVKSFIMYIKTLDTQKNKN
jgi:hypothetical protein